MNASIDRPVFIVGTGRSGTTILYSCLAMHPDFAWISSWVGIAPSLPMAFFNRFWDLPGTDRFRETRFFPRPAEPIKVFPQAMTLYSRELIDQASLNEARQILIPFVRGLRRQQGKARFLSKMAGRPVKAELLATVFPQSFFIHITRDLKPTVASLMQVQFYDPSSGLEHWPWGEIPAAYLHLYDRTGKRPEVAAAIKVRLNRIEQERQLAKLPAQQSVTLTYTGFVADPIGQIREIAGRSDLKVSDQFVERLRKRNVYGNADNKWKKFFTQDQVAVLDEFEALPTIDPRSTATT